MADSVITHDRHREPPPEGRLLRQHGERAMAALACCCVAAGTEVLGGALPTHPRFGLALLAYGGLALAVALQGSWRARRRA